MAGGRPAVAGAQLAEVGLRRPGHPRLRRAVRRGPPAAGCAPEPRAGTRGSPRTGSRSWASTRRQKAGKLSGGQRAQLALTLAIAKRPALLILDEPVASLDPLARREFLQDLAQATAEHRMSVVLSSHLVSDLERACDYLIVLAAARVHLAGPVADCSPPIACAPRPADLEDLVLAYMSQAAGRPATGGDTMTWLTWRQSRAQASRRPPRWPSSPSSASPGRAWPGCTP